MTGGALRSTVSKVALVAARALRARRSRKSIVALGAAGALGAALASVSLGPRGTRRARRTLKTRHGGGRTASHQLGNLLLQGLHARVDAVELDADRVAELGVRAAVEQNRGHRGSGRGRETRELD